MAGFVSSFIYLNDETLNFVISNNEKLYIYFTQIYFRTFLFV